MMGLRERVIRRFLAKRVGKKSRLLPTLWVVMDPTPDSLLIDILWKTTTDRLPEYILGSGAARWRKEHAALHDDEQSAKKDALARLMKIHGRKIPEWVLKTAALDKRSGYKGKDIYPNETSRMASKDRWKDMDGRPFDIGARVEYWPVPQAKSWTAPVVGADFSRKILLVGDAAQPVKIHFRDIPKHLRVKRAGYKGNPDGKDIYPNEINHGAKGEPLAGGTDVMRRLQNDLLHEQGNDTWRRPESPKVASLPEDFDEAEAYLNENMVKFPKKNGWWLPAHNLGVYLSVMGRVSLWVYTVLPSEVRIKGIGAAFRPEKIYPMLTQPAGLVLRPMWVSHPKYRNDFPMTMETVNLLVQMAHPAVTVGETAQRQLKQIEAHAGVTIPTGIKAKVIREAPKMAAQRWGINHSRVKSTFIPLDGSKPILMPS